MIEGTRGRPTFVVAAVGLVALAVVVGLLVTGGASPGASPAPTGTAGSPAATTDADPNANVPPIDCGPLLTVEDREEALAVRQRPAGEQGSIGGARGEVCSERLAVDERTFVRIEPGLPADFAPDAVLLGVAGAPTSGVGDGARWFPGTGRGDDAGVGILSVRKETALGALHYRIVLGRPDLDGAARLELAAALAVRALARFPGVVVERPDPPRVTFERDRPDRSGAGYVEHILAREASGARTLAEGLVEVLRLLAGESDRGDLLDEPESLQNSGTGVIWLARDYLAGTPDPAAAAEITRLLDLIAPSLEELEARVADAPPSTALIATISFTAAEPAPGDCEPDCLVRITSPTLDATWPDKYQVLRPTGSSGWTRQREGWALEAMVRSALEYESLGTMPKVTIHLTSLAGEDVAYSSGVHRDSGCVISLNGPMQTQRKAWFQQRIAHDMAYCLTAASFPAQTKPGYQAVRWWVEGLTTFLSDVVFPDSNAELIRSPRDLAAGELELSILDWSYENWALFEHLGAPGPERAMALIPSLATTASRADQESALAGAGIDDAYHAFAQELSDGRIQDYGQVVVPYAPRADEVTLTGPVVVLEEPTAFGISRLRVRVAAGRTACVEYREQGEIRTSWRAGPPRRPAGPWRDALPERLEGDNLFVVTAMSSGARFDIEVRDVDRDPDCENEEPTAVPEPTDCGLCGRSRFYFEMFPAN